MKNIERLFAKNKKTGECAGGLYLWAANMILIRELSMRAIEQAIANLIAEGEFEAAFAELKGGKIT